MAVKVAIVATHPIQHFCPLYRALAKTREIELKVFFGSEAGLRPYHDKAFGAVVQWQPGLVDGFDHEFLAGAESVVDPTKPVRSSNLFARLDSYRPDAVQIYGFYHPISRGAYC